MSKPDITADRLRELLDYSPETGVFVRRVSGSNRMPAGSVAGSLHRTGYVYLMVDTKTYAAHRLAWLWVHGCWPKGNVDHVNGDKADNRIANLRDVSFKVNMQNERRARCTNKSSGLLGVSAENGRFRALIRVDGVLRHLGTFGDPSEAHQAYLSAKRRLHQGCTI